MFKELIELNRIWCIKISKHSYNVELFEGSLPQEKFDNYLRKDRIYLQVLCETLSSIAVRATLPWKEQLEALVKYIESAELHNHHALPKNKTGSEEKSVDADNDLALNKYIDFLKRATKHPELIVSICAVLSCFTSYYYMGRNMEPAESYLGEPNPYLDWIAFYRDKPFVAGMDLLTSYTDTLSVNIDDELKQTCLSVLSTGASHEYNLYSSSYNFKPKRKPRMELDPEVKAEPETLRITC